MLDIKNFEKNEKIENAISVSGTSLEWVDRDFVDYFAHYSEEVAEVEVVRNDNFTGGQYGFRVILHLTDIVADHESFFERIVREVPQDEKPIIHDFSNIFANLSLYES